MITAKNYAAQAERALKNYSALMALKNFSTDEQACAWLAKSIKDSVHFAMPDNGKIFDNKLSGIRGAEVRLPFNTMTIEVFHDEVYFTEDKINPQKAKVLLICISDEKCISEGVAFFVFAMRNFHGEWRLQPVGSAVPLNWDSTDGRAYMKTIPILPESYAEAINEESFLSEQSADIYTVLELVEALSCKNVSTQPTEKIDAKVNERRIKAGKLPVYETRVLVIDAPQTQSNTATSGSGKHESPRQHLRRGHIRRLESGNIWVNACVVGDPLKGKINKSYQINKK